MRSFPRRIVAYPHALRDAWSLREAFGLTWWRAITLAWEFTVRTIHVSVDWDEVWP